MNDNVKILVRLMRYLLSRSKEAPFNGRAAQKYRKAFSLTVQLLHRLLTGKIAPADLKPLIELLDKSGIGAKVKAWYTDGGPGSGNFGHKGRPGKIGGSASSTLSNGHGASGAGSKSESGSFGSASDTASKPDYNCSIAKGCGKAHYDAIRDRVAACEDEKLRKIWYASEKGVSIGDAHFTEGPHFDGKSAAVYLDIDDVAANNGEGEYSLFFHESHHAIDYANGYLGEQYSDKIHYLSASYQNGKFPKSIEAEAHEFIQRLQTANQWSYEKTCFELGYQLAKLDNVAPGQRSAIRDVSDMLEGATNGDFCNFIGHFMDDPDYWTRTIYDGVNVNLATEAFAEISAAAMTNPDSLLLIKSIFPKSYAVYQEILGVIDSKE